MTFSWCRCGRRSLRRASRTPAGPTTTAATHPVTERTSLRRADARFLLPHRVRTAAAPPAWHESLMRAGIELVDPDAADVVVAAAPQPGARVTLVEGRARGGRILVLPSHEQIELAVPLGDGVASRYALQTWAVPGKRWKRARNEILAALLARGVAPPTLPLLTLVGEQGIPYLAAVAQRHGAPAPAAWFATFGGGDELSRGALHLFGAGDEAPSLVVKFARLPGYTDPFDREERGLARAAAAGGAVAAHAPRLLSRFTADGIAASIETAARGQRLRSILRSRRPLRQKLAAVERVAAWTVALALETRASQPAAELTRAAHPAARGDVATVLAGMPSVLVHGDLWSENIIVDATAFTAVDWEFARPEGPPLWDLWFFLSDALATLEGADESAERVEFLVRLWRGESVHSPLLAHWTRQAAAAMEIDEGALGALALLLWRHVGALHARQAATWEELLPGSAAGEPPTTRFAERWQDDPALGVSWRPR